MTAIKWHVGVMIIYEYKVKLFSGKQTFKL